MRKLTSYFLAFLLGALMPVLFWLAQPARAIQQQYQTSTPAPTSTPGQTGQRSTFLVTQTAAITADNAAENITPPLSSTPHAAGLLGLPGQQTKTSAPSPTSTPGQAGQRSTFLVTQTAAITADNAAENITLPLPSTPHAAGLLGLPGQQPQCLDCTPFTVTVSLTHYNPNDYTSVLPQLNCWEYSEQHNYCLSATWIGVPWESGWGLWAACPPTWYVGSWIDVSDVGIFICMDQGDFIKCDDQNICRVDILGPGGKWDGQIFDAILWVPKSKLLKYNQ